ncbi:2-octaprenyl-6-methoxyphenyl hydroxylase [Aurantivibrio infirmus]
MSNQLTTKNNSCQTFDIAIVGGGMVGISLALILQRKNPQWSIVIAESFPLDTQQNLVFQSSFDSRSTALSAGSRNILSACGLWDLMQEHTTEIARVHVSDKGHFGGVELSAKDFNLDALGYVVENNWLGQVLLSHLQKNEKIKSIAPANVKHAKPIRDGYRLTIESRSESERGVQDLDCQLLILADGVDSPLRKSLGIGVNKKDYRQSALVANVECEAAHQGIAYERFTDQGPIALLPLGESPSSCQMALVWTQPSNAIEQVMEKSEEELIAELQLRFGFRQSHFVRISPPKSYPLHLVVAKEQVRRSLVLMGNAAHFLHPVAGQGFNLALRDCESLANTLSMVDSKKESLGDLERLQNYLATQEGDQWKTIQLSDNFVRWFSNDNLSKSILRNLGLLSMEAIPPIKKQFSQQTMGLA